MVGIGIIHRNMSAEEQASQVKWVRRKIHFGGHFRIKSYFELLFVFVFCCNPDHYINCCQRFVSFKVVLQYHQFISILA